MGREMEQTVSADELRQVKVLLWERICTSMPPAERDEVKSIIGSDLIDRNQLIFDEVSAYSSILGDVRVNTDEGHARRQLLANPSRSLVENEVHILLQNIRRINSGSNTSKSSDAPLLKNALPREQQIIDFMSSQPGPADIRTGRPSTPRTPPSRPPSSRSSRAASVSSSLSASSTYDPSAMVDSVGSQLNINGIDEIKAQLREFLEEEHNLLLDDSEYLQLCLDDEADRKDMVLQPPSISELRELGSKLEATWIQAEQSYEHEKKVDRMMAAADKELSRVGKLRTLVGESRTFEEAKHDPDEGDSPLAAIRPRTPNGAIHNPFSRSSLAPIAAPDMVCTTSHQRELLPISPKGKKATRPPSPRHVRRPGLI